MELLFKTYPDKPARIAIAYPSVHQARIAYELLLTRGAGQLFELRAELQKNKLMLILTSEQNGYSTVYKDIEFKPDLLRKLMWHADLKKQMEFVHVYKEGNVPLIARPFLRETFITLMRTNIVTPGSYEE